ncbi:MAG: HAD-superfamily hydrolase subfamily variant 3 [Candidatus Acidoferrum typicum]|nr:HAD-superfamily hydrolase subfamily variant 3 [Candidatus Acidoferrum typicum]
MVCSMTDKRDPRLARARQIGAVVLDYGEVLCSRPSPDALVDMAGMFGIDAEKFLAIYRSSRNPYDRGDLTADAYWAGLARRAGVTIDSQAIEKLRRLDVQMWSNINQEMTEWLARIHSGGFRTAILSNMQTDMAAHARRKFDWLRYIDHQVFSCEVRSIKPHPAIYQHTLAQLDVPQTEVLFVDDREENIQAARALGICGIRFESVAQFRCALEELSFPILPVPGAGQRSPE